MLVNLFLNQLFDSLRQHFMHYFEDCVESHILLCVRFWQILLRNLDVQSFLGRSDRSLFQSWGLEGWGSWNEFQIYVITCSNIKSCVRIVNLDCLHTAVLIVVVIVDLLLEESRVFGLSVILPCFLVMLIHSIGKRVYLLRLLDW